MTSGSILLVEDNENDVIFMKRMMRVAQVNCPLRVVTNGQEAIDYLAGTAKFADRAQFPLPTLVLLDLKLPQKSGLEVLHWIRHNPAHQTLVVLILSTSREPGDIERAYRLCANAYLVKPHDVGQLAELMKSIKAFWLTFNEFHPG
jgi:CheY-like chemotaxis protein